MCWVKFAEGIEALVNFTRRPCVPHYPHPFRFYSSSVAIKRCKKFEIGAPAKK
jgi:hypothetical protein